MEGTPPCIATPVASIRPHGNASALDSRACSGDLKDIQGYRTTLHHTAMYWILVVATGGLVWFACRWWMRLRLALAFEPCSLAEAEYVLTNVSCSPPELVRVETFPLGEGASSQATLNYPQGYCILQHQYERYIYDPRSISFQHIPGMPVDLPKYLHCLAFQLASGTPIKHIPPYRWAGASGRVFYGANELKFAVRSLPQLIFKTMADPLYAVQCVTLGLWIFYEYYIYFGVVLVLTWFSILTTSITMYYNSRRLAALAQHSGPVRVLRAGELITVASSELLPGDVVEVTPGAVTADLVLVKGTCMAVEELLTGEGVPLRKVPYSPIAEGKTYDPDEHKHCTLMAGTHVGQCQAGSGEGAWAVVVRTGFYCTRGRLMRSALLGSDYTGWMMADCLRFLLVMCVWSGLLFTWTAVTLRRQGYPTGRIVIEALNLAAVAVPPVLPAALSISEYITNQRLRGLGVYVNWPSAARMAGVVDVVCFDKTGTLTGGDLQLVGVAPVIGGQFMRLEEDVTHLPGAVMEVLGCCHDLTEVSGKVVGDPLDLRLFLSTGWTMREGEHDVQGGENVGHADYPERSQVHTYVYPAPGQSDVRAVEILHRFPFSPSLSRNVVLASCGGGVKVMVKGSPEVVAKLVGRRYLPPGYRELVERWTRRGLRVVTLAAGDLAGGTSEAKKCTQDEVEACTTFHMLGLVALSNLLRPDTCEAMSCLRDVGLRCVMVTGDHLHTSLHVARQCGILAQDKAVALVDLEQQVPWSCGVRVRVLDVTNAEVHGVLQGTALAQVATGMLECVTTGAALKALRENPDPDPVLMEVVLSRSCVFARMSPDDKTGLVQMMRQGLPCDKDQDRLAMKVAFCGDGVNDAGALQCAHMGIALTGGEACVAAPMTAAKASIHKVVEALIHGRHLLSGDQQMIQFIVGYAFVVTMTQNLLITFPLTIGNTMYLVLDLFFATPLAIAMAFTSAPRRLSRSRSRLSERFLTASIIIPTTMQLLLVGALQGIALGVLRHSRGYKQTKGPSDLTPSQAIEVTVLYLMDLTQIIALALVFNKGRPSRQPLHRDPPLLVLLLAQSAFVIYTTLSFDNFNVGVLQMKWEGEFLIVGSRARYLGALLGCVVGAIAVKYLAYWLLYMGDRCGQI